MGLAKYWQGTGGAQAGILGLGYNFEAPIVDVLQAQGLIQSRAFSLYLDHHGLY